MIVVDVWHGVGEVPRVLAEKMPDHSAFPGQLVIESRNFHGAFTGPAGWLAGTLHVSLLLCG